MNPPEGLQNLKEKVDPKPLDDLTRQDADKGSVYLCMVCGEEFRKGKKARGHAGVEDHRKWIRHSKLPKSWDNPYSMLAQQKQGVPDAY